jgi:DNA-binding transcriptional MerR regulator
MSESDDSLRTAAQAESYTIEMVARITRIPEEQIAVYWHSGFVSPVEQSERSEPVFDEQAIHRLRRIAFLLSEYGINREGLTMISELLSEVERLREEVRFLRER